MIMSTNDEKACSDCGAQPNAEHWPDCPQFKPQFIGGPVVIEDKPGISKWSDLVPEKLAAELAKSPAQLLLEAYQELTVKANDIAKLELKLHQTKMNLDVNLEEVQNYQRLVWILVHTLGGRVIVDERTVTAMPGEPKLEMTKDPGDHNIVIEAK